MTYTRVNWVDGSGGGTPLSHDNLNVMDAGVSTLDGTVNNTTGSDGATMPSTNGPFTFSNWLNYILTAIKGITGASHWYSTPAATLASLSSGKLDSSSYTAADVLTKIKTVDGSGSGLDADTLDGSDSTAFAKLGSAANFTSTLQNGGKNVVFAQAGLTGKWSAQSTAPTSPADGDLWLDTSTVLG